MWMGLIQSEQGLRHHDIKEERRNKQREKKRKDYIHHHLAKKTTRLVEKIDQCNKSLRCSVKGGYKGNRRGHFLG